MNVTKHPYYRKLTKEIMNIRKYIKIHKGKVYDCTDGYLESLLDCRRWFRESMKKGGE